MLLSPGLYIVATPLGNLRDISERALDCLANVDLIACEDTRVTATLLQHYQIKKPLVSFHAHNEKSRIELILKKLSLGLKVALVSDAGTPLIRDPGEGLIQACHRQNFSVTSLPGPCALITALTLAGASADRFFFAGFLPSTGNARKNALQELLTFSQTVVFYEAPHRICSLLELLVELEPLERDVVLLKELTKQWERRYCGSPAELLNEIATGRLICKGEFVVVLTQSSNKKNKQAVQNIELATYQPLLELFVHYKIPLSQASSVLRDCTSLSKKQAYAALLALSNKENFTPLL